MNIDPRTYQRIAEEIRNDRSPVGIDAKKTHVMILAQLEQMQQQLDRLERVVARLADVELPAKRPTDRINLRNRPS